MPEPDTTPAPTPPDDLDAALRDDEIASLRREGAELREKLDASHSKTCGSCGVAFQKGVGKVAKKKAAKEKAEGGDDGEEEKPTKVIEGAKAKAAPKAEPDDDECDGFGFFD